MYDHDKYKKDSWTLNDLSYEDIQKMGEYRQRILKASYDNPYINSAILHWRNGHMTFEQAMVECVLMLSTRAYQLETIIGDYQLNNPLVPLVSKRFLNEETHCLDCGMVKAMCMCEEWGNNE